MLPLIVSSVGVICGFLITIINCHLIWKFWAQDHHKTHDLTLFFYRFHMDVLVGFVTICYLGHLITFYLFPDFFESTRILVLWLGLATSNLQMARMMLSLFVTFDRIVAAFFPIKYRIYRTQIPTLPIFLFTLATGLFQDFIFFYCCDFVIYVPKNCLALGCVMNSCFKTFWSTYQTVVLSVIVALSVIFCVRLFLWSKATTHLSQANRLAILDAITIFIFQFIPPFCVSLWPDFELFNFSYAGPFNLVGKLVGSTIESFFMLRVMRKKEKRSTVTTVAAFSHVKQSSEQKH